MPYIDKQRRVAIAIYGEKPQTTGELNFAITALLVDYLGETPRYADYNEVIGVLECAKLELYAQRVRPYEDKKIRENGSVY